ncbi:MAG: IclR family transcriptional regulator [Devosia sp.]|uniref:IclR family transcriptional regulator n=1 Tax=Devosia sp. TaxID=1871048 RepID=UPI001ACF332C|nr:IclR family transcriptional regulator [Devosia sp.]MBN9315732.1 IclR family transcriptional regulator [Devosia sp.]
MSSIIRSVQAMDLLARKGPLGVRAVAQQLQLPLGSVHRMLLDLAEAGVADRTPAGEWELSFRLLEITGMQLERIDLPRLCRPFAERIAEATSETVNVNALSGLHGVCIDKVRGNEGMQLDLRIGSRGPLNCGGAGKAMLAFMSEDKREEIYNQPLSALTSQTITDPARLREEIGRIRARFYSIDDQEVVMGVYCVAVPILDRSGTSVGAMSVTGPSVKKPGGANVMPIVAMLWDACEHVSRRLGFAGAWPPVAAAAERMAG